MKAEWKRSADGFCESVDGKWYITPLYCGRVKPQFFDLWYYPRGIHVLPRRQLLSMAASQRECKEWVANAENYPAVLEALTS